MISRLKYLLSYLKEITIEQSTSDYNPLLLVTLKNGRYRLLAENAIYSYDDLYDNFKTALKAIHIKDRELKEVLILGLGLGSIPYMLEKTFKKECYITAIELDEEVVRLASKYTLKRLHHPFDIVCTDASIFIEITEEKYDLICIDIFKDDKIPDEFYTKGFLEHLKTILNENGIILFNHLGTTEKDIDSVKLYFKDIFKSIFPEGDMIRTRHNFILINHFKFLQKPS